MSDEVFDIEHITLLKKPSKGGKGEKGEGDGSGGAEEELDGNSTDDHTPHEVEDEEVEAGDLPTAEDIEAINDKVRPKTPDENAKDKAKDKDSGASKAPKMGGRGGRGDPGASKIDWKGLRPRFNWKDLLARLVRDSDSSEPTYQKLHRRNITGIHVAAQTGAGAVKPGEKMVPSNLIKLCIVIDSSGSMSSHIPLVMATIHKLLMENGNSIAKNFAMVEFSGNFNIYSCVFEAGGKGTATPIAGVAEMGNTNSQKMSIDAVLSRHVGGSTNFDQTLTGKLREFLSKKYNVLILTDTDIVAPGNAEEFVKLYSEHREKVYLLLDSHHSFVAVAERLSQASANISHIS